MGGNGLESDIFVRLASGVRIFVCTCMHVYVCECKYVCEHVWIYVCEYACMCAGVYTLYVYVCVCVGGGGVREEDDNVRLQNKQKFAKRINKYNILYFCLDHLYSAKIYSSEIIRKSNDDIRINIK